MRIVLGFFLSLLSCHLIAQNTNRLIVKIKEGVDYSIDYNTPKIIHPKLEKIPSLSHLLNIRSLVNKGVTPNPVLKRIDLVQNIHFIELPSAVDINTEISNLLATGLFEYVEKDAIGNGAGVNLTTPTDSYFTSQWSLKNNGTFSVNAIVDADIDMDAAWDITTGDAATIVCVLDAGFKMDHPELAGRIWQNPSEIAGNGIDDDGNGYIDDIRGWDWANNDNNPTDDHGHGTNVGSIIAAKGNNSSGMAGINWNCKLMVGKILDAGNSGLYSWFTSGIYYAVNEGAKVINMSVGGSSYSAPMKDACDFAMANNVMIAVCMHNQNTSVPYYPAAYPSVIAVGSTSDNDYRTHPFPWDPNSGSNYGSHIDLVAPGNYILGASNLDNVSYNYWAGTSQATPEVAGVISLMLALKPNLTFAQVMNVLATTSEDLVGYPLEDTPGWDQYYGYGRLNAQAALNAVLALVPLKFGNIAVRRNETSNELSWSVLDDYDLQHFLVEYSTDRIAWKTIENVPYQNNSNGVKHYAINHFIDNSSDAYYRVKAVNNDQSYTYSRIVRVGKGSANQFTITKVIADKSNIKIFTTADKNTECTFSIYSIDGKLFYQADKLVPVGNGQFFLSVNLAAGRYQLVATAKNIKLSQPMLIR